MSLQTLYEKDFYSWINKNVLLLKAHKLEKLDVEHLIEELEGMARSQKRALIFGESWNLKVVIRVLAHRYKVAAC
jgi:hypothetical protein